MAAVLSYRLLNFSWSIKVAFATSTGFFAGRGACLLLWLKQRNQGHVTKSHRWGLCPLLRAAESCELLRAPVSSCPGAGTGSLCPQQPCHTRSTSSGAGSAVPSLAVGSLWQPAQRIVQPHCPALAPDSSQTALPSPGTSLQLPCNPKHRMAHQFVSRGDIAGNNLNPQRLNQHLNSLGWFIIPVPSREAGKMWLWEQQLLSSKSCKRNCTMLEHAGAQISKDTH